MGYGEIIREHREAKGLRQRDLADRLGCTDSYITYIETEKRQPSPEFLAALVNELEFPEAERERLAQAVQQARAEMAERRQQARSAAVRSLDKTSDAEEEPPPPLDTGDMDDDPTWRALVENIRTAYGNPTFRDAVVQAAWVWAEAARSGRPK